MSTQNSRFLLLHHSGLSPSLHLASLLPTTRKRSWSSRWSMRRGTFEYAMLKDQLSEPHASLSQKETKQHDQKLNGAKKEWWNFVSILPLHVIGTVYENLGLNRQSRSDIHINTHTQFFVFLFSCWSSSCCDVVISFGLRVVPSASHHSFSNHASNEEMMHFF